MHCKPFEEIPVKKVATIDPVAGCCAPLLASPLSTDEADELAATFKALADPVRLRLLSLIAAAPEGTRVAPEPGRGAD